MEIIKTPDYETLGQRIATDLLQIVTQIKAPLICPTGGSTPLSLYKALVQQIHEQQIDYSSWYFVGLDEWGGMNGQDKGSCREFLDTHLFQPLHIKADHIQFFDGRAANLEEECQQTEAFIRQHGGITVATAGLGMNGHIGMNEPGTPANLYAHVAEIAEETKQIGQKYFDEPKTLTNGMTLGMATLLEAKHVFVLVNGEKKAPVVRRMIEEPPSEQLPATLLRQHPNLRIYLDEAAAKLP